MSVSSQTSLDPAAGLWSLGWLSPALCSPSVEPGVPLIARSSPSSPFILSPALCLVQWALLAALEMGSTPYPLQSAGLWISSGTIHSCFPITLLPKHPLPTHASSPFCPGSTHNSHSNSLPLGQDKPALSCSTTSDSRDP